MKYAKSVFELVALRKSVRTYADTPVPPAAWEALDRGLASVPAPPLGSAVRLMVAAPSEGDVEALKGLGTYGVIRRPAGFVIGAAERSDRGLVDAGYALESIVLLLADLGLGSCWLGGSFRKTRFSERIRTAEGECVPAVVSLGPPAGKPRAFEKLMRAGAGSDSRLAFEALFSRAGFGQPLPRDEAGPYGRVLETVRLAPSASNRQPWRIVFDPDRHAFHFFLKRDAGYARQLKWFGALDLQKVDMGIAACHFEFAAGEAGLSGAWARRANGMPGAPEGLDYQFTWEGSRSG